MKLKVSGETGTIHKKEQGCRIFYSRRPEFDTAEEKLGWLGSNPASQVVFERVEPDDRANWINLTNNDWDSMIPIADKKTKAAKSKSQERAIFKLVSLGVSTNRDDWCYDFSSDRLVAKVEEFVSVFNEVSQSNPPALSSSVRGDTIKWTTELVALAKKRHTFTRDELCFRLAQYRPFVRKTVCYSDFLMHRFYGQKHAFPQRADVVNTALNFYSVNSDWPLATFASSVVPDLNMLKQGNGGTYSLPRKRFVGGAEPIDNITDWALNKFVAQYGKAAKITKDDIFHYVYGVLHDPVYRETYAHNLKRELPRIPFYPDFRRWADWGKTMMDLHLRYETVEPWPLERTDTPDTKAREAGVLPKPALKADKTAGIITLDSETTLSGFPTEVWDYKLGNRSALEWILDQHKEKTPKDKTIREKFNTYRFADHKEKVVDLLARVTRVSIETMEIVEAMKGAKRTAEA